MTDAAQVHHQMRLRAGLLPLVLDGRKSVEVRLADDKRSRIRLGDLITFTASDPSPQMVTVTVTGVRHYRRMDDLVAAEDLQAIAGGPADAAAVVSALRDIYGDRAGNTAMVALSITTTRE